MRLQYPSPRVIRRPEDMRDMQRRMRVIAGWGIFGFLILLTGLWYKQIVQGEKLKDLSERNYIRLVSLKACRGTIYDRKGITLANNQPLFKVVILPQELRDVEETVERLSHLMGMEKEKILKKVKKRSFNPFNPVVIKEEVDMEMITAIEERKGSLPGVFIRAEPRRNYPFGKLAAHLLGYLGRVKDGQELEYRAGDRVGQTGVEKAFNTYLEGRDGGQEILVNSQGEQIGILGQREAIAGYNLILTIDKELQEIAEKSLEGKRGAIVAVDPENGDILALVGSPAFDPNIFTKHLSPEKFREVSQHSGRPFFNRAVTGLYPPASTFKIVVASAALEKGVINPGTTLPGENGEQLNIIEALAYSSDPVFYKLGEALGVDNITYFARRFGLGTLTGIELPYEKKGLVPDRRWRKKWPRGEIDNLSIGQGALEVTPLQMASLIAAVANGGKIYRPRIVKEIRSGKGDIIKSFPVQLRGELPGSKANLDVIKKGLWEVVNRKGKRLGTGWRARMDAVEVAGKTGTAETTSRKFRRGEAKPYEFRDHAWFVAFAPFENPKIALAVLVEHGGWGGVTAAPLAKEILEAFFSQENKMVTDGH